MNRRRFSRNSSGLTLVELVVVIVFVGLIIAMFLPAVQMSERGGRRNTCAVNQKNLALAIANYSGARKWLPGYRDSLMTNSGMRPVSWATMILPYIDQRPLWDQWKNGNPAPQYIELLACPNDPQDTSRASTSYAVNCGLPDKNPLDAAQIPLNWTEATPLEFRFKIPADWSANGAFVSRWEPDVSLDDLQRVRDEDFYDGMTNTILLSENLDATVWNDAVSYPPSAANGYVKLAPGVWNTPEISYGIVWTGEKTLRNNAGEVIANVFNGLTTENGEATEMSHCRPSSKHPGGVNIAFADGRVVFINEEIDYEVYCLMMTPDGRNATPNGRPKIETDDLPPEFEQYKTWRTKAFDYKDLQ